MTIPAIAAAPSEPRTAPAGSPAQAMAGARARIAVIDVLRGLVMLIMLFDHVRETLYLHKQVTDPMDAATTEPMLFFTRVAAHFCAPVFVFLTGLGAWLYANPPSGMPRSATAFLVKRGLLLILLEWTVVNFAWFGDWPPGTIYLQVIWVIGLAMIALALLEGLPRGAIAAIAIVLVCGHNALSPIEFRPGETGYGLWTILHDRGFLVSEGALKVKVSYPLLPWIGVILLGYLAGPLYAKSMEPGRRRRVLVAWGLGALAALTILRGFNIYGETLPWVHGENALRTAMSWVNFTKYPPSLDFLLLTLGGGCLLLAWLEPIDNALVRAIAIFGGAPMFYYILHLYVLMLMQKALVAAFGPTHGTRFGIEEYWPVWLVSFLLMPLLYYPCRAFARYKRTSKQAWVRYF